MELVDLAKNPFKVFTPEGLTAEDVTDLFVPVQDFHKIKDFGHTMLNGPRGCGKSMIFRYLMPDCQCLKLDAKLEDLDFFGILISIKNTAPNLTEFLRLDDRNAKIILAEHVLCAFVATTLFASLRKFVTKNDSEWNSVAVEFYNDVLLSRLRGAGWPGQDASIAPTTPLSTTLDAASQLFTGVYHSINTYAGQLSFPGNDPTPYHGALLNYLSFLHPLLNDLRGLPFLPNGPFYLLIDDGDYLSHTQTRVLNSWVATRTQHEVSIKISTQLRYKTFSTISGTPIQSPHDFQEINIADIYTSQRSKYRQNLELILEKRLEKAGIPATPLDMFPADEKQEKAIQKIAKKIKNSWPAEGKGYRESDDVTRYSRPEYIKQLGGTAKSKSIYRYAGFDQLVHISSRLIRYFLEPAAQMFDEERSKLPSDQPVLRIDPETQNRVIREQAEKLMFTEFDKIVREDPEGDSEGLLITPQDEHQKRTEQLQNLIRALGGTFHQKLISDDTERRVFSVAISGLPDPEVMDVFELGVRYGYFHRSSIGNKDGTGRTRLFVLTRRLAPHFMLDPSSFAGYLWVTSDLLRKGMANPEALLRRIKKDGVSKYFEMSQLTLFD